MLELFSKRLKAAEKNQNKLMEALMRKVPRVLNISSTQPQIYPFCKFEREVESWLDFLRQLQLYFEACGVTDAVCKKACLLSWLSPTIFKVVSSATTAV
ncbi:hypothetical protein GJ496_004632 [Pomphorhynchus laevis]|nr:hypothetical protein GJ496_004632 [Pomphorhynchus laevis]